MKYYEIIESTQTWIRLPHRRCEIRNRMNLIPIIVSALLGLAVSWLLVPVICKLSATWRLAARASTFHHTHKAPISRLGGVGLAVAFLVVVLATALWWPE